jgi:hypothetical protein
VDNNQQLPNPTTTEYHAERARADAAKAIYYQTTVSRGRICTTLATLITVLTFTAAIAFAIKVGAVYSLGHDGNMAAGVVMMALVAIFAPILLAGAALSIFLFVHSRKLRNKAAGILYGREFVPDLTAVSDSVDTKQRRRYINYAVISGVGIFVLLKLMGIF